MATLAESTTVEALSYPTQNDKRFDEAGAPWNGGIDHRQLHTLARGWIRQILRSLKLTSAFSSEVGTGSREENALIQRVRRAFRRGEIGTRGRAFSSEVGTGSRQENALIQRVRRVFPIRNIGTRCRAFSSEVGTASRQENRHFQTVRRACPIGNTHCLKEKAVAVLQRQSSTPDQCEWAERFLCGMTSADASSFSEHRQSQS